MTCALAVRLLPLEVQLPIRDLAAALLADAARVELVIALENALESQGLDERIPAPTWTTTGEKK